MAGLHLLCLAVSEFVLLVAFALNWPWPHAIKYKSVVFCIITNFLVSSQQTWSGLLMVSMTIERYFSVAFPLKVKLWNLKRITKVSMLFLGFCSLILGGLSGARRTVNSTKVPNKCVNNPDFKELNIFSNNFTYTAVGFGLCPVITFIFTVLIAHQLFKHKRARQAMTQEGQTSEDNREFVITVMLFLVACMFLLSKIFQVTLWYIRSYSDRNSVHFQHASVGMFFARLLIFVNHAVNSLVYIIFFKSFREAFVAILCFKWKCWKTQYERQRRYLGRQQEMSSLHDENQTVSSEVSHEKGHFNTMKQDARH